MRKTIIIGATLALFGCGGQTAGLIGGAQQAALQVPPIAEGCARWRAAEADPRVRLALDAAKIAANVAGYGAAGTGLAWLQSSGDRFCTEGPPAGDVTADAQRYSWLAKLTADLIAGAIK